MGNAREPGGLARDCAILEAVATKPAEGLRITDIAEVTHREKSQVSRAVRRLVQAGLLAERGRSRRFVVGPMVFQLAQATFETYLVMCARPHMRIVVNELGETVHLTVLQGDAVLTIHSESPSHGFRALEWSGVRAPTHATSSGRVLLSGLRERLVTAMFPLTEQIEGAPRASRAQTGEQLLEIVRQARDDGYAIVVDEFEVGLCGASAPIRDGRGVVVAALNVAAPVTRFSDQLAEATVALRHAALAVSAELSGSDDL